MRKWTNLELVAELLQDLLCACHDKFHSAGHQIPRSKQLMLRPRPGRKPGRYGSDPWAARRTAASGCGYCLSRGDQAGENPPLVVVIRFWFAPVQSMV